MGIEGLDIVGDVHGHADKLVALLSSMGYRRSGGAWSHPGRVAVFVGDLIDRGPGQVEAVGIVRAMVERGSALACMGNHELNALAWAQPSRLHPGRTIRGRHGPKGDRNLRQHQGFLGQAREGSALHRDLLGWFQSLPLWLELPGVLVAHACWHPRAVEAARARLGAAGRLDSESLAEALEGPAPWELGGGGGAPMGLFEAVEAICKGPEVDLPQGASYKDAEGFDRTSARLRWWDPSALTLRQAALAPEPAKARIPDVALPDSAKVELPPGKAVFFGHYWMSGEPAPAGPLAACVDYSAAAGGPLAAYRYDGESRLSARKFALAGSRA